MTTRLAELRRQRRVSITELARFCGVTREIIYNIERGKHQPRVLLALKIASRLGLTVEAVFSDWPGYDKELAEVNAWG